MEVSGRAMMDRMTWEGKYMLDMALKWWVDASHEACWYAAAVQLLETAEGRWA